MNIYQLFISFLFFIFVLTGCFLHKDNEVQYVKERYTDEEINIFFELINDGTSKYLTKWDSDIFFFVEGSSLKGDSLRLENVQRDLNNLDIPIKIKRVYSKDSSNVTVKLEGDISLREELNISLGHARKFSNKGIVNSAEIIIFHDVPISEREIFFLHEFIHVLGFPGHISTCSNSIMRKYCSGLVSLTSNEKQALRLLYEPVWKNKYTISRFQNQFGEILRNVNPPLKLYNYLDGNRADTVFLRYIYDHDIIQPQGYEDAQVFKFVSPLRVRVNDDLPPYVIDTLGVIVEQINSATNNFQIEFPTNFSSIPTLDIKFVQDETLPRDSTVLNGYVNIDKGQIFNTIDYAYFTFSYSGNGENWGKKLGNSIFSFLFFKNSKHMESVFEYSDSRLSLKTRFKKYIRFYYSTKFPQNISKSELEDIRTLLNNK